MNERMYNLLAKAEVVKAKTLRKCNDGIELTEIAVAVALVVIVAAVALSPLGQTVADTFTQVMNKIKGM